MKLGPRPAGSPASRKLAGQLKAALPRGSYQLVPGGLRNVVDTLIAETRATGPWLQGTTSMCTTAEAVR